MGHTNASPGWDESIHHADGSHRLTAPSTVEYEVWKSRRDAHVAIHVAEAKKANEPLRTNGDSELADLADKVAEASEGGVYFCYTTAPTKTKFYVFQQISGRHTRNDIIALLHTKMAQPGGL